MKVLPIIGTCLLTCALCACSSRTEEPDASSTDTNIVPNENANENGSPSSDDPIESNSSDGDTTGSDNQTTVTQSPELSAMVSAIKRVTSHTLYALNTGIRQGAILSPEENTCLRAFDPAFGQSLLAINCDQPLFTNNVAIGVSVAGFTPSDACHAGMANNDSSNCEVSAAQMSLPVQWTISDSTDTTRRPLPLSGGASISYKIEGANLVLQNLPSALAGAFECVIDMNNAQVQSANGGNCTSLLAQFSNEINELLNNEP